MQGTIWIRLHYLKIRELTCPYGSHTKHDDKYKQKKLKKKNYTFRFSGWYLFVHVSQPNQSKLGFRDSSQASFGNQKHALRTQKLSLSLCWIRRSQSILSSPSARIFKSESRDLREKSRATMKKSLGNSTNTCVTRSHIYIQRERDQRPISQLKI